MPHFNGRSFCYCLVLLEFCTSTSGRISIHLVPRADLNDMQTKDSVTIVAIGTPHINSSPKMGHEFT